MAKRGRPKLSTEARVLRTTKALHRVNKLAYDAGRMQGVVLNSPGRLLVPRLLNKSLTDLTDKQLDYVNRKLRNMIKSNTAIENMVANTFKTNQGVIFDNTEIWLRDQGLSNFLPRLKHLRNTVSNMTDEEFAYWVRYGGHLEIIRIMRPSDPTAPSDIFTRVNQAINTAQIEVEARIADYRKTSLTKTKGVVEAQEVDTNIKEIVKEQVFKGGKTYTEIANQSVVHGKYADKMLNQIMEIWNKAYGTLGPISDEMLPNETIYIKDWTGINTTGEVSKTFIRDVETQRLRNMLTETALESELNTALETTQKILEESFKDKTASALETTQKIFDDWQNSLLDKIVKKKKL